MTDTMRPEASDQELSDDCPVHRALLRSGLYDPLTLKILTTAFLRRRDDEGSLKEVHLSVADARKRSATDFAARFKKCHGVARTTVEQIHQVGDQTSLKIEVVPSPTDDPLHADLRGMPDNITEDEHIASLLAAQASLEWRRQ